MTLNHSSIRRLLLGAGITAAVAFSAPASASADTDALDYCGTTATGWEQWVDKADYSCTFARAAYRKTRAVQIKRGGFIPGDRFVIYADYETPVRGTVIAWDDHSFTIRLHERPMGVIAEFELPV